MNKKVLIISYTFPPSSGIGGRRWAKFGKYLEREGFKVFVLAAQNRELVDSPWLNDIVNLKIYTFKSIYPQVLLRPHKSLLERFIRFLASRILPYLTKGTIYDRSFLDKKSILRLATKIISENNIENIVVTGAPFNLLYYGALLKKRFKFLNFVADLRDPWLNNDNYGFKTLSASRKKFEESIFEKVVQEANYITIPSPSMKDFIINFNPKLEDKIEVLPHGYDEDDFLEINFMKKDTKRVKLIYGGTLYEGIETHFNAVLQTIKFNKKISFDIYSPFPYYKNLVIEKGVSSNVAYNEMIPNKALMNKITQADFYLMMYPKKFKDFLTTKFFEIVYLRIPIIYIGYPGEIWNFIRDNNIGITLFPELAEKDLPNLLQNGNHFPLTKFNNLEIFSLKKIVHNKLLPLLK
jgi:glycosyltransferase involved in cell wall biosynthesis